MKSALLIVPLCLTTASGFVMRCSNLGKNMHVTDQTQHGESCDDMMAIPRTRVPEAPQGRTDLRYVGRIELPVISSAEWEKARVVLLLNTSVHVSKVKLTFAGKGTLHIRAWKVASRTHMHAPVAEANSVNLMSSEHLLLYYCCTGMEVLMINRAKGTTRCFVPNEYTNEHLSSILLMHRHRQHFDMTAVAVVRYLIPALLQQHNILLPSLFPRSQS